MSLKKINPTGAKAWNALGDHHKEIENTQLKDLFASDKDRAKKFTLQSQGFFVDYSKNNITSETKGLLIDLAKEVGLKDAINKYFDGDIINETEGRAVLHTALRAKKGDDIKVDGENVMPEVYAVKAKIKTFTEAIISGQNKGYTGKAFTDVVNIGIGGSDLGPAMVTEALKFYGNHLKMHFVSNVDGDHVYETLKGLDPETDLIVLCRSSLVLRGRRGQSGYDRPGSAGDHQSAAEPCYFQPVQKRTGSHGKWPTRHCSWPFHPEDIKTG